MLPRACYVYITLISAVSPSNINTKSSIKASATIGLIAAPKFLKLVICGHKSAIVNRRTKDLIPLRKYFPRWFFNYFLKIFFTLGRLSFDCVIKIAFEEFGRALTQKMTLKADRLEFNHTSRTNLVETLKGSKSSNTSGHSSQTTNKFHGNESLAIFRCCKIVVENIRSLYSYDLCENQLFK